MMLFEVFYESYFTELFMNVNNLILKQDNMVKI